MTPRRPRDEYNDASDIARGAAAVWRNRGVLVAVASLLGLVGGGGVSTYFSSQRPSIDSLTVARAVQAGMDPVLDTLREHGRNYRDLSKDVQRIEAQADKTDGDLRQHLLASIWTRSSVGRSAEMRPR